MLDFSWLFFCLSGGERKGILSKSFSDELCFTSELQNLVGRVFTLELLIRMNVLFPDWLLFITTVFSDKNVYDFCGQLTAKNFYFQAFLSRIFE